MSVAVAMNLKPYRDRVLCLPVSPETQTAGGIIIPETARRQTGEYVVHAIGEGAWDPEKQSWVPIPDLAVGDHVILARYPGADVSFVDSDEVERQGVIIKPDEILGVFRSDGER